MTKMTKERHKQQETEDALRRRFYELLTAAQIRKIRPLFKEAKARLEGAIAQKVPYDELLSHYCEMYDKLVYLHREHAFWRGDRRAEKAIVKQHPYNRFFF